MGTKDMSSCTCSVCARTHRLKLLQMLGFVVGVEGVSFFASQLFGTFEGGFLLDSPYFV